MSFSPEEVRAGQAVYTRKMLAWYDLLVLGLSCRFIWKCPASRLLKLYNEHASGNHLEVGVGTGYFLDRCRFAVEQPQITLLDLNRNCLEAAGERIVRYRPSGFVANILEPLDLEGRTFDSIGLNFVLHCLPGNLREKGIVFDHLRDVLNPGGVLFGSTLLAEGVRRGWTARRLMGTYNRKRIFSNAEDSLSDLETELSRRFTNCRIETRGCGALFVARKT